MTPAELKTIRKALGHTQVSLAAAMGVSAWTVRSWEQGRYPVRAWTEKFLECLLLQRENVV